MRRPPRLPPAAARSAIRATMRSSAAYFSVSGQNGDIVGVDQVRGSARRRSDIDLPGIAVHQLGDLDRDAHAAVVAAPDRLGEEVVPGLLEPRERAERP